MNGQWIRRLSLDDLYTRVSNPVGNESSKQPAAALTYWPPAAAQASEDYKRRVLALAQDRLKTLTDLPRLTSYFFEEPARDDSLIETNKQLKKLSSGERQTLVRAAHDALITLADWTPESIQQCLNDLLEKTGQKPGILFSLIRIATTWTPFSPQLNDTLALLGKETTLRRLASF